jgi:hypothetical protein
MPITHAKHSTKGDGSDSGQVQPSDWNADHVGGSGLPSQWTDGGHGDVIATVDLATLATLTVTAPTSGGTSLGILRLLTHELPADTVDVFNIDSASGGRIHSIDSSGEVDYNILDPHSHGLLIQQSQDGATEALVEADGNSLGGSDPRAAKWLTRFSEGGLAAVAKRFFFGHSGFVVGGLNAAPADGDLIAGDFALWLDSTNGASKLMIKAKSANGTVVTGSVNLT